MSFSVSSFNLKTKSFLSSGIFSIIYLTIDIIPMSIWLFFYGVCLFEFALFSDFLKVILQFTILVLSFDSLPTEFIF